MFPGFESIEKRETWTDFEIFVLTHIVTVFSDYFDFRTPVFAETGFKFQKNPEMVWSYGFQKNIAN